MTIPRPQEPSIEELEAMTLEERVELQWKRSIPFDQLPAEMQERIQERALRHITAREEAAAR